MSSVAHNLAAALGTRRLRFDPTASPGLVDRHRYKQWGVPAAAGTPHTHVDAIARAQRQRSVIRKPTIIVPKPTAMFHAPSFGTGYVPDEM